MGLTTATGTTVLAGALLMVLVTPAWGQSTEEIEEWIALLAHENPNVRWDAADALGRIGPNAAAAVPALTQSLSDENVDVRRTAAAALGLIGPRTLVYPALTDALFDKDEAVRKSATWALGKVGTDLKTLWWVVPRVYGKQLVGLLALLLAWFTVMGRFPRHRPPGQPKHLALMALAAVVPVSLACSAVYYAITREWAQGFLPDAVTVVPFPVAAVLSTALVCVLPAIWVCQRKALATEAVDEPTPPTEPSPSTGAPTP